MQQRALIIESDGQGGTRPQLQQRELALPRLGRVRVEVSHSGLNYKDALAVTGRGRIVRRLPLIPGIDLAGVVSASADPRFVPGQTVLATGWGLGEEFDGGYTNQADVAGDQLLVIPEGLDPAKAMTLGTAGLTAMLSIMALEQRGIIPEDGEILISGASGGVGSIALLLLARAGYRCVALSGRPEAQGDFLRRLGAQGVLDRAELLASKRPLDSARWAGAVDVAGGATLHAILKSTAYGGSVAACGLADSAELATNVFPFILRGVNLLGIDSVHCPVHRRSEAWHRLARDFPEAGYAFLRTGTVGLEGLPAAAAALLDGELHGRWLVEPGR